MDFTLYGDVFNTGNAKVFFGGSQIRVFLNKKKSSDMEKCF